MKNVLLLGLLISSQAFAGADRVLDGKFITSGGALLTLPTTTDTIIGRDTTDTLTNKTLTSPVINSPTGITKSDVGLSNVDNTSDANKPISTATQTALNAKQDSLGFTPEDVANKSTNTALGTSDTLYPSQNAVKSYVDTAISGVNIAPTVTGTNAAPVAISAASGISFSGNAYFNIKFIEGSGGAVNITANPQVAAGTSVGQRLTLISKSATNTVTLEDSDGLSLNGTWVGALDSVIALVWNGSVWMEESRR